MRLDLSKEQINSIIDSLEVAIDVLEKDKNKQFQDGKLYGYARDLVEEVLTIRNSTLLYLKDFTKDK